MFLSLSLEDLPTVAGQTVVEWNQQEPSQSSRAGKPQVRVSGKLFYIFSAAQPGCTDVCVKITRVDDT